MRRFWNSRAVRVLSLVLILSLCLLLHLEYRVENLLREAEEAKLSVENERRERDIIAGKLANSMKHQYTLEKESLQSEEIENEKPQNMEKERTVSFHKTLKSDVSNDETVKLSHQKKSHFKYVSKVSSFKFYCSSPFFLCVGGRFAGTWQSSCIECLRLKHG